MSTPISTNGDASPAPSARRDLRDRWQFRVAALVVVLLFAAVVTRACASKGREISDERAVELAKQEASFTPDRFQVRFVQRGVPAHGYWGVSLYNVDPTGRPTRREVYLVDAKSGVVTRAG